MSQSAIVRASSALASATTTNATTVRRKRNAARLFWGENETTPPGRLRARSGRARRAARAARTRTRGGRGSSRGRRTHAGVSVGRHAGSSCCVNLESAGDVRTGSGDGGERERGERSRAHETLVDAGASSRAHRRRGTHFSAPNSASGRTTRARAHESDEASEVRKAFFVFVRASSSVARVLSEKYTTDTLRPKSDPALLCHHASTT